MVSALPLLRIDLAPAAEALGRVGRRLVEALRAVRDPMVPVPGLDWTLGELTAHLAARTAAFAGYLDGSVTPEGEIADLASLNARQIEESREVPFETQVELVAASVAAFVETTKGRLGGDPYPWHSSLVLDVATGTGIALAELLVHGHDVGRATRRPWPIDADDARTALKASIVLAPQYLDRSAARGKEVTFRLSVRGLAPVRLRIADDALEVLPPGTPADATILARPVPLLLVSFGRLSRWRAFASGGVLPWGRKPWLAATFDRYFRSP
ncbi:MAG TPA: maleylpyruvate isomerase N-terminal domain-containing protein [Actinomycetota bacterium]|nr:maleylpyruvate isomerase N-terminal domain-containing protein [Actinomycetota bacterium]